VIQAGTARRFVFHEILAASSFQRKLESHVFLLGDRAEGREIQLSLE